MEWKNFPVEVQERMLENQVLQGNERNPDVFIELIISGKSDGGFDWCLSEEGHDFWESVIFNKVDNFYKLYPK